MCIPTAFAEVGATEVALVPRLQHKPRAAVEEALLELLDEPITSTFLFGRLVPCQHAMPRARSGIRANFGQKLCYSVSAQLSSLAIWPLILLFVYPFLYTPQFESYKRITKIKMI